MSSRPRVHRRARAAGVATATLGLIFPLTALSVGGAPASAATTPGAAATTSETGARSQSRWWNPTPGSPGVGDEVFPKLGNGGYDALRYDLDFTYQPDDKTVDAKTRMIARATQDLSRFDLDAAGLDITALRVNGREAEHRQDGEELVVTPAHPLPEGVPFVVTVSYTADPATTAENSGWVPTKHGFALANQPAGAHTVFPSNDHPSDKAFYRFHITAPDGTIGVANGRPVGKRPHADGTTTYAYRSTHPIATELVQVAVGDYEVVDRGWSGGVRLRDVVPTGRRAQLEPALELTRGQLDWISDRLGDFPQGAYGLLPVNTSDPDAFDFTGLETQTLTLYKPDFLTQPEDEIGSHMMHELTHSWFGNSVTPENWSSLWINEGHADYYGLRYRYERGWPDSNGFTTFEQRMKYTYSLGDAWREESGPVAKPTADNIFDAQRYTGAVLVLYALHEKVGPETFDRIERAILSRYADDTVSTEEYIDTAVEVSGNDDVRPFLRKWLYGTKTPPMPGHPDWTVDPPATVKPGEATPPPGSDITGNL